MRNVGSVVSTDNRGAAVASNRERDLDFLRKVLIGPGQVDEKWLGLEVLADGAEAVIVFRWGGGPTTYAVRADLDDPHPWWHDEARATLREELRTGLIERGPRCIVDGVTELDLSGPRPNPPPRERPKTPNVRLRG